MKLRVLLACHNRRELTVQSLIGAKRAADAAGVKVSFTVFDDGSQDGTSEAVISLPMQTEIIRGDGNAFWARSMAKAEASSLEANGFEDDVWVLWLNDDVVLDADAFQRLRICLEHHPYSVIVGSMRDPSTGTVTYSGLRKTGIHPLSFSRVQPSDRPEAADTFNGNLVAVPLRVAMELGGIDGGFAHGFADIDYGLRCGRLGIAILVAPGTYGTCARNPDPPRNTIISDWRSFTGPKGGGNFRSLKRIMSKSHPASGLTIIGLTYIWWWVRRISNIAYSGRMS